MKPFRGTIKSCHQHLLGRLLIFLDHTENDLKCFIKDFNGHNDKKSFESDAIVCVSAYKNRDGIVYNEREPYGTSNLYSIS